jgi:hypothetical protein
MKKTYCLIILLFGMLSVFAQKQTFDIATYAPPKGWTEKQGDGNISYSRIDGASWAQIAIYQHRNCDGDIQTDFDKDWNELVASNKTISSPEKTEPKTAEGWTVMSGSGVWQYNGANVASILTVYSNNSICIAVLCNATAQPYLKNYKDLIGSLDLDPTSVSETNIQTNTEPETNSNPNANNTSIAGLWTNYILETTGYNVGGMPQYTAGYLRKEYQFNADGTYTFRNKQWLTKAPDITFIYETGTYSVNGNQLTLTPVSGKGGFWAKMNSSKEWGKLKKYADYKLEKTTYNFEIIEDATYGNSIVLKPGKPTTRDGGQFNAPNDPYEFRYSFRELESSIDNPPGFKINAANKSSSPSSKTQQVNSNKVSDNVASPLSGNWSYSISESAFGSSTTGYSTRQYTFTNDGTYKFVYKVFSSAMNILLLQYENGNYAISGKQVTISPISGGNEEWSQNNVHPDQWGNLLKTSKRKLEKVTYTFTLQYFSGIRETDLILQAAKPTEREGAFGGMQDFPNGWVFKPCNAQNNPMIELPKGWEKLTQTNPNITISTSTANTILAGKTFEGTTLEKSGTGNMQYNTGGYWTWQYHFNKEGTYRFVYVAASHFNEVKLLQYETGTYSVNGDQLTVSPVKGANEEWSKIGITSNGNSDVSNRAIYDTWNKKLKTSNRKLEKITYPFSIQYLDANKANTLILQHHNATERDGSPGWDDSSYYYEISPGKSGLVLPNGFK